MLINRFKLFRESFCIIRVLARTVNMEKMQRICLFDVDGTLTKPRQNITEEVESFLKSLKTICKVGLVGGSDLNKIREQMGPTVTDNYDYVFAENGLVAYRNGQLIGKQSILQHVGEEKLQKLINFCLAYMSKLSLPTKRGNFVEYRNGLINICPVGRSCSQAEREEFSQYDKVHGIRKTFVEALQKEFSDTNLVFAIGGEISFDVFPRGWDKTFCLESVQNDGFNEIHFFGDKTSKGGNDHEIYSDSRTIGHTVIGPEDTVQQLKALPFVQSQLNSEI